MAAFQRKILSVTEPHYRLFGSEPTLSRILLSEILLHTPGLHLERHIEIRTRLIKGMEQIVAEAQRSGEIHTKETPEMIARSIFFLYSAALRWWLASEQPDWRSGQRDFERVLKIHLAGLMPHTGEKPSSSKKETSARSLEAKAGHPTRAATAKR